MGILSGIGKRAAKISKAVKVRRRELAREKYKKTFDKLTDKQKKKVQDQAEIEVWGPDPGEQEAKMMDRAKAADKAGMRRAKGLAQEGMAAAAKPKPKSAATARTEADVAQLLKEGQRKYDTESGMVFKRGGLIGPSYRHGRKDYRKGGMTKRMK